jgi:hypothetical protein
MDLELAGDLALVFLFRIGNVKLQHHLWVLDLDTLDLDFLDHVAEGDSNDPIPI